MHFLIQTFFFLPFPKLFLDRDILDIFRVYSFQLWYQYAFDVPRHETKLRYQLVLLLIQINSSTPFC
jgi:hypothetical protein